jgi:DNA-binding GntR family transcriptional regulator
VRERGSGLRGLRIPERRSLSEEIAAVLRERILSGELPAGSRMGEMEVAQAFGTSQAPVREAFAMLRSEGLLVTLPRRGTFVSSASLDDVRAAYEIRKRLDPYVTERALPAVTEEDIREMERLVEGMRETARAGDLEGMTRFDLDLHGYLYARTGAPILARIWDLIASSIRKFIVVAGQEYFAAEEFSEVAEMHAALVELVRRRDVHRLQEELRRQLDLFWQRIDLVELPNPPPPA